MVEKNVRAVLGLTYILNSGTFDGVEITDKERRWQWLR